MRLKITPEVYVHPTFHASSYHGILTPSIAFRDLWRSSSFIMHRAGRTHTGILKRKHEPAARTSERRKLPVRAPNPSIRARETARCARARANIDIETIYGGNYL